MDQQLKPMDVYAQIDVPVAVGIFCRTRKHCQEAIALQRALNARQAAKLAIAAAEEEYERSCERVRAALQGAQQKMEKSDAVQS